MLHLPQIPTWFKLTVIGLATMLAVRFSAALDAGVSPTAAARTYVFWALVCAPVAYLVHMLFEAVMEYRFVQLALARVKNARSRP